MSASAGVVQSNETAAFCEDRVLLRGKREIKLFFEVDLAQKIHCYLLVIEWDCTPCVLLT